MRQDVQALMDFVSRSVSPYHGAAEVRRILREEGFEDLPFRGDWQLSSGGKYCVDCRSSMVVAFTVGESVSPRDGFRIVASHLDWPCFYVHKLLPQKPKIWE